LKFVGFGGDLFTSRAPLSLPPSLLYQDYIDATYASREEWILQSVLHEQEIVLEDNKFPYNTPKGIRHLTLWARRELSLEEVEDFMTGWMEEQRREGGREVRRWNLDENASRSIQVYHVHVYVQVGEKGREGGGEGGREGRRVCVREFFFV